MVRGTRREAAAAGSFFVMLFVASSAKAIAI